MAIILAILAVRLVIELANRLHYRIIDRQRPSFSRVMSAVATDRGQLGVGATLNNKPPPQVDINITTSDLSIDYPVYVLSLPRFASVDDRRSFIEDGDNRVYLVAPLATASKLAGRIRVVWNGVIRPGHECSWKTSDEEFGHLRDGEVSTAYVNKTLCPLLVPDGQTFQHFVDGVLPKLVQLLTEAPHLAAAVDSFVVYRPRDAVIYELLRRVGIGRERLMLISPGGPPQVLEAQRVVDTCVTPPVHPRLARRASRLLYACQDRSGCDAHREPDRTTCCLYGESEPTETSAEDPAARHKRFGEQTRDIQHQVTSNTGITNTSSANSSVIVLLSRRWSRNGGRRLLNENAVFDYLVGHFGRPRVARFGNGRVDLTSASGLFSRAVAVVGVHGGAFYNIILARPSCVIVELMPLVARRRHLAAPPRRLAHTIVWRLADALGHTYWRLYAATSSLRGDVTLSINKLRSALAGVT